MLNLNVSRDDLLAVVKAMLAGLMLVIIAVVLLLLQTPLGAPAAGLAGRVFVLGSVQTLWYVTRAAGLIAYLLLWLSTAWGLVVSSKLLDPLTPRAFTFDAHEFLSLLALGFTGLHIAVLMADRYLPFSLAQVLVPFAAPYRPVWTGLGVIGLYVTVLVSVTFYLRRQIGNRSFRVIHYLSYLSYGLVTLHGWFAGTDTALTTTKLMYAGTALVVVFLTVYRIVISLLPERAAATTLAKS